MNLKVLKVLTGALLFVLMLATDALANVEIYVTDGTKVDSKYVNRDGSDFGLDETPYLYMLLEQQPPIPKLSFRGAFWNDPNAVSFFSSYGPSTNEEALLSLNWGNGLNEVSKTPGLWTVNSFYNYFDGTGGTKSTNFSFVPEPISSTLLLIGAGTLLMHQYRKKKRARKI